MEQKWATPEGFSSYIVSNFGVVWRTSKTVERNIIHPSLAGRVIRVNMKDDFGVNRTKSVARLVAECHVPQINERFDTVIQKDGNHENYIATNLAWRTRSDAYAYRQQFKEEIPQVYREKGVVDEDGRTFLSIVEAGIYYGVAFRKISYSTATHEPEFYTNQIFTLLSDIDHEG